MLKEQQVKNKINIKIRSCWGVGTADATHKHETPHLDVDGVHVHVSSIAYCCKQASVKVVDDDDDDDNIDNDDDNKPIWLLGLWAPSSEGAGCIHINHVCSKNHIHLRD